jgi:spore coat polysaccharide biosynthesis predicted glycosyltransferase SpsG
MNIQAEKIELIKLIADIESEKVLKRIKSVLKSEKRMDETDRILSNPAMVKHLDESIQQIKDGKGIKISLDDDIWK